VSTGQKKTKKHSALSCRAGFECVEALGRIIISLPLPTLKCYNLHALTIVIITKYRPLFILTFILCKIKMAILL